MATWFWRHQCEPHTTCSTPCTHCASPGAAQVDKKTLTLAPWISSTGPAPARTGIRNSNVSRWIYGQPQDFQLPAVRDRLLTLRCWRSGQLDEGRLRVVYGPMTTLESSGRYRHGSGHSQTEVLHPLGRRSRPSGDIGKIGFSAWKQPPDNSTESKSEAGIAQGGQFSEPIRVVGAARAIRR